MKYSLEKACRRATEITPADIREVRRVPDSYGYHGDHDMGKTWGLGPILRTRDTCDPLEISNARMTEVIMEEIFPRTGDDDESGWDVERFRHFGFGWVEQITFKVVDGMGRATPEFGLLMLIRDSLEEYPILSEEDYSEVEYDAILEWMTDAPRREWLPEVLPDWWEGRVLDMLEGYPEYTGKGCYRVDPEDLRQACWDAYPPPYAVDLYYAGMWHQGEGGLYHDMEAAQDTMEVSWEEEGIPARIRERDLQGTELRGPGIVIEQRGEALGFHR